MYFIIQIEKNPIPVMNSFTHMCILKLLLPLNTKDICDNARFFSITLGSPK